MKLLVCKISNKVKEHYLSFKKEGADDFIAKQRLSVFSYSVLILVVGVSINLSGISGPQTLFFQIANSAHLFIVILLSGMAFFRVVSLVLALSVLCIVTQLEISAEMVYCALMNTSYYISLILGNTVLMAVLVMLSVITYLRFMPYIIVAFSLLTYSFCVWKTGDSSLQNFFLIFLIVFFILALMWHRLVNNMKYLESENTQLKEHEQEVLNLLEFDKTQLMSYIALAKEKGLAAEQVRDLLENVGEKARENIQCNVSYYMRQTEIEYSHLQETFSMLSPSELEICRLILQGMKVKEIGEKLKKTPSNITCQRTNIRSKLGLQREDDLEKELRRRMECRNEPNK